MALAAKNAKRQSKKKEIMIPVERIKQSIVLIRGQKVMLDRDLAKLYGVETRVLNQAVRGNIKRFPEDFMFALTRDEIIRISQIVTSSSNLLKNWLHVNGVIQIKEKNRRKKPPEGGFK
jgi:hypothetical protein